MRQGPGIKGAVQCAHPSPGQYSARPASPWQYRVRLPHPTLACSRTLTASGCLCHTARCSAVIPHSDGWLTLAPAASRTWRAGGRTRVTIGLVNTCMFCHRSPTPPHPTPPHLQHIACPFLCCKMKSRSIPNLLPRCELDPARRGGHCQVVGLPLGCGHIEFGPQREEELHLKP